MKVIAIKCECCNGDGLVTAWTNDGEDYEVACPVCDGLGTEYPREDKKAQKHVEGVKE